MGHKRQFPAALNWQSTSPIPTLLPLPANQSSTVPSGVINGVMATTGTIYSQIIDMSLLDNIGAEVTWSGTPTGTISVLGSNSGLSFYAITFDPVLAQPAGSAGGYLINLNQWPFKYLLFKYVNASGSGTLNIYLQSKDVN